MVGGAESEEEKAGQTWYGNACMQKTRKDTSYGYPPVNERKHSNQELSAFKGRMADLKYVYKVKYLKGFYFAYNKTMWWIKTNK